MDYHARVVDTELRDRLASSGAVVIEGPKACGKTSTARQASSSEVLLDVDENARQALRIDPALVLDGAARRLGHGARYREQADHGGEQQVLHSPSPLTKVAGSTRGLTPGTRPRPAMGS